MKKPSELLAQMPGLAGEIARLFDSHLEYSQPNISIVSALAVLATVKCGKFITSTGVRPNMYFCVVGESGCGKTRVQGMAEKLINNACSKDMYGNEKSLGDTILTGKPASDVGILFGLQNKPRQLLIWDELGVAFEGIKNSREHYKTGIFGELMELFSKAGERYRGRNLADHRAPDLEKPFLNILGASTPQRLMGALNENSIYDGLLTRWIMVFAHPDGSARDLSNFAIPPKITEALSEMENYRSNGDLGDVAEKVIEIEGEYYNKAMRFFRSASESATSENKKIEKAFLTRARELYSKTCIALSTTSGLVEFVSSVWAYDFVDQTIKSEIDNAERNLGEIQGSSLKLRLLDIIPFDRFMSANELYQKTRGWLNRKERIEILKDLEEAEIIEQIEPESKNLGRKTLAYRRNHGNN